LSIGSRWSFPGFEVVEHLGSRVLARPEAAPWVRFVLESGKGLHAASAGDKDAIQLEGRYPVFVVPEKTSGSRGKPTGTHWAVRHFARGGRFVSTVLKDRYVRISPVRPYHEVEASEEARKRGISTPRVVAAATYTAGLFYRADLVTDFIPNASDLVEVLFDTRRKGAGGAAERLDALRTAGEMVRRMADAGLRHRDLHARNILLEWQGIAPKPHLLDLDRCDVRTEGTQVPATPMYQRLRRSLMKWERRTRLHISEKEWETLAQAVSG
jgi:3-deoxy-D-manno-octulosonic acid kinase